MTYFEFEEQDRADLVDEIAVITQAAVDAGRSYTVRMSKSGEWWKAVVTVGDLKPMDGEAA